MWLVTGTYLHQSLCQSLIPGPCGGGGKLFPTSCPLPPHMHTHNIYINYARGHIWGCGSLAECLPGTQEALGSVGWWCHRPLIPALRRQGRQISELASQVYKASSRTSRAVTEKPCFEKKKVKGAGTSHTHTHTPVRT